MNTMSTVKSSIAVSKGLIKQLFFISLQRRKQVRRRFGGGVGMVLVNAGHVSHETIISLINSHTCHYVSLTDLHRTFPDNAYFECTVKEDTTVDPGSNPRLSALRRILLAFSLCAPHIGYCQSLNYLAGIFLLVIQDEESAFWMLVTTIQDFFPEDMYDATMEGARIDQTMKVY